MDTIAPTTDTRNGLTPDHAQSLPVRTPFQATLLGDDAGSQMAWTLWRQGYERGAQSGYAEGYADGIADMIGAADQWREDNKGIANQPTRAELERRRNTVRGDLDTRTGAQIIADAHASWATLDRTDQAA